MNKISFLPPLTHISYVTTVIVLYILKWQYWAKNEAGAGAKIRKKFNNFGLATLVL